MGSNLERALSEEPRPGAARKLTGKEEALLAGNRLREPSGRPRPLDAGTAGRPMISVRPTRETWVKPHRGEPVGRMGINFAANACSFLTRLRAEGIENRNTRWFEICNVACDHSETVLKRRACDHEIRAVVADGCA